MAALAASRLRLDYARRMEAMIEERLLEALCGEMGRVPGTGRLALLQRPGRFDRPLELPRIELMREEMLPR